MTTHRNSAPAHTRSLPIRQLVLTLLGWSIALIIFFPILWMVLTGFKTETAAIADPSFIFSGLCPFRAEQHRGGVWLYVFSAAHRYSFGLCHGFFAH